MKILVVDDLADDAGALAQGLHDLTGDEVTAATGAEEALQIVQKDGPPDVLITEAVLKGTDGFSLRDSLQAVSPGMETIYVTGYDLTAYSEHLGGAPVFYKPLAPEALLPILRGEAAAPMSESQTGDVARDRRSQSARLRNLVDKQGFTGKLDQFDLVDIIQMCCVSKRTGRLQIARKVERGVLFLRGGQIIHAVSGQLEGEDAAYEIVGWTSGQFSFDEGVQPENQTIHAGWEHVIMEGVRRRDEAAGAGPAPDAAPEESDANLTGRTIGPYQLRRKIGQGSHSQVFEAVQTSMDRVVALKVLLAEYSGDEAAVRTFLAQASAKANVQHPSILAVYEAGQHEGLYYYAREFADGATLSDLRAQGRVLDDVTALQCIKVASEALSYLNHNKIPHPPLTAADIYIGRDGRTRVNNLASLPEERTPTTQQDIRTLSRTVSECLPSRSASAPGLRSLLGRMLLEGSGGFLSWGALLQAVRALEPKVVPEDAFKLSAQEAAAAAAVGEAKRRQKRALILSTVGMFGLFWIVCGVVYVKFFRVTPAKSFDHLIEVPSGEFIYQMGEKRNLPTFWIDEYEVTIGQYAEFLDATRNNPYAVIYENPAMPKGHTHENVQWINLYAAAKSGGRYNGAPVDLNCPAVFLDWFDACAYAKWKGRRLPTEEEWEKAARGTDGRRFPWGNDPTQIAKVNTSADYHKDDGSQKGEMDGYNRWAPVDAMTGDKSPYGVMGMAGNVSEWTATLTRKGSLNYPVVCGGNFASADVEVTRRVKEQPDLMPNERIGFRTVSDAAPAPRK